MSSRYKLIVGLGNPGSKYQQTRHNLGFSVLDLFARKKGLDFNKKRTNSLYAIGQRSSLILLKPQTYMNLSGRSVSDLISYYQLDFKEMLVIHDDLDLAPGQIKFKVAGGTAGHKGLQSINEQLGSENFMRLRIGIGRSEVLDSADYVLQKLAAKELQQIVEKGFNALELFVQEGITKAMNALHGEREAI